MFDAVSSAAIKMTGTAGVSTALADILSDVSQVDSILRVTGITGWFAVFACGVMADQAIDILFSGEVEVFVFPAISYVTC